MSNTVEVCVNTGGINWCWYYWIEIDFTTQTAREVKSDRWHKSATKFPEETKGVQLLNRWHQPIYGVSETEFVKYEGVEYPVRLH